MIARAWTNSHSPSSFFLFFLDRACNGDISGESQNPYSIKTPRHDVQGKTSLPRDPRTADPPGLSPSLARVPPSSPRSFSHHHSPPVTLATDASKSSLLAPRAISFSPEMDGPQRLFPNTQKQGRRRRSSSIIYQEPPESIEHTSDQAALPNLNANWVHAKGELNWCYGSLIPDRSGPDTVDSATWRR